MWSSPLQIRNVWLMYWRCDDVAGVTSSLGPTSYFLLLFPLFLFVCIPVVRHNLPVMVLVSSSKLLSTDGLVEAGMLGPFSPCVLSIFPLVLSFYLADCVSAIGFCCYGPFCVATLPAFAAKSNHISALACGFFRFSEHP